MKHVVLKPQPVAICTMCEATFVGSAHPPHWEMVKVAKGEFLLCPDCATDRRARARKGGAA